MQPEDNQSNNQQKNEFEAFNLQDKNSQNQSYQGNNFNSQIPSSGNNQFYQSSASNPRGMNFTMGVILGLLGLILGLVFGYALSPSLNLSPYILMTILGLIFMILLGYLGAKEPKVSSGAIQEGLNLKEYLLLIIGSFIISPVFTYVISQIVWRNSEYPKKNKAARVLCAFLVLIYISLFFSIYYVRFYYAKNIFQKKVETALNSKIDIQIKDAKSQKEKIIFDGYELNIVNISDKKEINPDTMKEENYKYITVSIKPLQKDLKLTTIMTTDNSFFFLFSSDAILKFNEDVKIIDPETGLGILGGLTIKQNQAKNLELKMLDYSNYVGNVYLVFNPNNKKQEIKSSFTMALLDNKDLVLEKLSVADSWKLK